MSNNTEPLPIIQERVDELPLLLAQMREMQLPALLNEAFPTHQNWQGLSLGHLVTAWLAFILAQSNHRLSHLRSWAATCLHSLAVGLGVAVVETDFTDDRLAQALDYLQDHEGWRRFEDQLNRRLIRVYDLETKTIRLDSTTAKSFGTVTADGLLQFGHSKDHRPDLPQLKIQLATLDPLGLPLTATVVNGNCADDPLYVPELERVRATLQKRGLLFVGDSKMAALATRTHLAAGGDYYLCPLAVTQMPAAELAEVLAGVRAGTQPLTPVWRRNEETGRKEKLAEGYEYAVQFYIEEADGRVIEFSERRLVVRSLAQSRSARRSLQRRLKAAQAAIKNLGQRKKGKTCPQREAEWRAAVDNIRQHYKVAELLQVSYTVERQTRQVRAYGAREARSEILEQVRVQVRVDQAALEQARFMLGWRVYVSNAPAAHLSLTQAVLAYRGSYLIERGFRRLKGHALSLTPLYLTTPGRLTGLVRVLLIGLRVLGLLEYKARHALQASGEKVAGLTKGLPQKATARPTAEALLQAFEGLTLFRLAGQWYLTPLNALQKRLLQLLGFSEDIYHCLLAQLSESQVKMSET